MATSLRPTRSRPHVGLGDILGTGHGPARLLVALSKCASTPLLQLSCRRIACLGLLVCFDFSRLRQQSDETVHLAKDRLLIAGPQPMILSLQHDES